jgi:hypothetical protein
MHGGSCSKNINIGPVGKLAVPLMGKFEGQVMCAPHKY